MQNKLVQFAAIVIVMMAVSNAYAQIGRVGINTTTPAAVLHVKDSSVLFTGIFPLPSSPGNPPVNGAGTRMMWYPDKAAFRAGYVSGTQWNKDSIGNFSLAIGHNSQAIGVASIAMGNATARANYAIAMGNLATASGNNSLALGPSAAASGIISSAIGQNTTASGIGSLAMGYFATASGPYSTSLGFFSTASAPNSVSLGTYTHASDSHATSFGAFTNASGYASTTMGFETQASGGYATASGYQTLAAGLNSVAMGKNTLSSGNTSLAHGDNTHAKSYSSVVIGRFNDTTAISKSNWQANDPVFIIGNGTANNARKNALTVLKNGRTGINTSAPLAMLHVKDSSVVFTGPASPPATSGPPPVTGAGARMMWYPDKGAFRVGRVTSTEWNKDSIGNYSFAAGYNSKAIGENSFAGGYSGVASGEYSTTLGRSTTASGSSSVAIGAYSTATNIGSTALGYAAEAHGFSSTAIGTFTKATGEYCTSLGRYTHAKSYLSLVLGRYNDTTSISSSLWNDNDPLFIIGNGSTNSSRSNALTILKNGKVGIGIPNPGFLLNFSTGFGDKVSLWGSSGNHYGFGVQSGLLQIHTDAAIANVVFGYGRSDAFTETMRIEGTGNVGIGTNTPDYKLDVQGRARIASGGNAGTSAGIYFNKVDNSAVASFTGMLSDDYVGFYGDLGAGWDLVMHTGTGNVGIGSVAPSQRLHVAGNGYFTGNVGIGAATPLEKLHVVGAGYITGKLGVGGPLGAHQLTVIGDGYFSGNVIASCGLLVCSDERYKTNIHALTNALSSILLLQGIQYNWRKEQFPEKDFPDKSQIGFSAQELEKVYPEMVHTDADGYKTVDYTRLTPVLVEAMKEQQIIIEDQRTINQLQQSQIDILTRDLNQLKEMVIAMSKSSSE